jgi:hypothetical protein
MVRHAAIICGNNALRKQRFSVGGLSGNQLLNLRWPDAEQNVISKQSSVNRKVTFQRER